MRIKHFILIAAVALVASSCAHSFEAEQTQPSAIGFGTWAETLTKARTAGANSFVENDDFAVYGFYTKTGNTEVFDKQQVIYKTVDEALKWTYTPLRFWDPTASSYTFYAISPYSYGAANSTYADYGLFTCSNITFAGNDNDILVANKTVVEAADGTPKYSSTPVTLTFNHIASMVDVKVKMDAALAASIASCFDGGNVPENAGLRITNASLKNIHKKGSFTVSGYNNSTKVPVIGNTNYGWVIAAEPVVGDYSATASLPLKVTATTPYTSNTAGDLSGTPSDLFTNHLILMPQQLSDDTQKLHIEYEIITQVSPLASTSFTADIDLTDFVVSDKDNNSADFVPAFWAPGTHYTYTVTIGANAITFTAEISAWTPASGYRYLVQ